ncbi:hypothetical protein GBAR_LOCUS22689, partial [Geodia barretti]
SISTIARNFSWLGSLISTLCLSTNPSGSSLTLVYSTIGINTPSVTGGIGGKYTITAPQVCPPITSCSSIAYTSKLSASLDTRTTIQTRICVT